MSPKSQSLPYDVLQYYLILFPEDKYNLTNGKFDEEVFKFKVTTFEGEEDELSGEYILDLRNLEINKL